METKQSLRKFFILMVTWLVTIIAIFAGSILYDNNQASEYHDRAVPYIKQIVPIISQWDAVKARELMAPEISAEITEEKFSQVMARFSRLGALQKIQEPEFEDLHPNQNTDIGKQTIVEYNVDAKYENGDATINLKLIDRRGALEVYQFNVSAEILANK